MNLIPKEKIRLLDAWGTSPDGNASPVGGWGGINLPEMKQFLTLQPDRHPTNSFIGFSTLPFQKNKQNKRIWRAVVWGKEPLKEEGANIVRLVADHIPVVMTKKVIGISPNHTNAKNLGVLTSSEYFQILSTSTIFLGVGDYACGSAAVEAISQGMMVAIPVYDPPLILPGKPTNQPIETQHPWASAIGEPCTYSFKQSGSDVAQLVGRMKRNYEEHIKKGETHACHSVPEHSPLNHLCRVRAIASGDWDAACLKPKARWW